MTPASKSARAPKPTAGQKAKAASDAHKTVARNRKATHDYFIEDRYEAGLVLTGTEVKALRMGRASLTEAWIEIDRRRGLAPGGAYPRVPAGDVEQPLPASQAQAAPAPQRAGTPRNQGPGQGLHGSTAGAVLHRGTRQAGDRPSSG